MIKIKNLREPSIDSLKYRIPIHCLKSYNQDLNANMVTLDVDTDEIEREFKRVSKVFQLQDYIVRAAIENSPISNGARCDVLAIGINAKQLENKYFEGITTDNIEILYKLIIDLEILDCSLNTFIDEGFITDLDIKKDFPVEMDDFKELIKGCDVMTKESKKSSGGNDIKSGSKHYAIYWGGARTTKNWKSYPFTKIYHKSIQIAQPKQKNGMREFKDSYLSNIDTSNLMRIETTVKNREHLLSLNIGLKKCNLREILNLNHEQLDKILAKAFNQHLTRNTSKVFKKEKTMTPSKEIIFSTLCMLINDENYSFDRALKGMIRTIPRGSNKTLKKKEITKIYEDYIYKTDYKKKTQIIENIYDEIGLI
tara:strand:+ start:216 stop:1316 length:1101 start_codon:yes stop_codon:yes gene_type:complete